MRNTIVLYLCVHSSGMYADLFFQSAYIQFPYSISVMYIEFDILKLYWNKLLEGGKGLEIFHFNFILVSPCEEISWPLKEES